MTKVKLKYVGKEAGTLHYGTFLDPLEIRVDPKERDVEIEATNEQLELVLADSRFEKASSSKKDDAKGDAKSDGKDPTDTPKP